MTCLKLHCSTKAPLKLPQAPSLSPPSRSLPPIAACVVLNVTQVRFACSLLRRELAKTDTACEILFALNSKRVRTHKYSHMRSFAALRTSFLEDSSRSLSLMSKLVSGVLTTPS